MSGFLVNKGLLDPTVTQYAGGTATFTLPQSGSTNATEVFVGGVPQIAGVDFNVTGTTLTLTTSAPAGSNFVCARQYFSDGITGTAGANTVATSAIQAGAITAAKIATGVISDTSTDVRLAYLMIAENQGDRLSMDDGIADPFKDETDIDTSTSANETYDATSDFYSNPEETVLTPASSDWTVVAGNWTIGTGDVLWTSTTGSLRTTASFAGDFDFVMTLTAFVGTAGVGFFASSELGSITGAAQWNSGSMTNSFAQWDDGGSSQNIKYGSTTLVNAYPIDGTVLKFTRRSGVIKVYSGVTLKHTYTQTYSDPVYFACGTDSGANFDSITITYGNVGDTTPANMTLVSNAFTATAVPATGRIHIQVNPVDSITINTDLTAEISRDGGSNWTAATLALKETLKDGTLAYEDNSVTISGQPSGTAMKYRVKTLNNKEVQIHGAVLQWST